MAINKLSKYLSFFIFLLIALQFLPGLLRSLKEQYSSLFQVSARVGVLEIRGEISKSDWYIEKLKGFFKKPHIKAILLKIESPGGAAGSCEAVYNEILTFQKTYSKPMVTLVENVCGSGGYYIAAATDYIITAPSAMIGSIGTALPFPHLKEFINHHHIKYQVFKKGVYKDAGDMFTDITLEESTMLQHLCDVSYKQFVKEIASRRHKLSITQSDEWANGRIFTGIDAVQIGLADELGSISTAERVIKELAAIEGEIKFVKAKKVEGFMHRMFGTTTQTFFERMSCAVCNGIKTFMQEQRHIES